MRAHKDGGGGNNEEGDGAMTEGGGGEAGAGSRFERQVAGDAEIRHAVHELRKVHDDVRGYVGDWDHESARKAVYAAWRRYKRVADGLNERVLEEVQEWMRKASGWGGRPGSGATGKRSEFPWGDGSSGERRATGGVVRACSRESIRPPSRPAAPETGVFSRGGVRYTDDLRVSLTVGATGYGEGKQMRFSHNGGKSGSAWQPFAKSRSWDLVVAPPYSTEKTVAVQVRDVAGNTDRASDGIQYRGSQAF